MKKLIWLLLIAATSMWAQNTNYNPGTTAIILNAVTTTGTGTCYAMLNQGAIPANFTWQTVIAGGTASSITVVFEGSLNNDCSNPSTIDTSTSTSGETRSVANKAYPYITANITAYSRNGTTATVNFVAQYGSGVPTPSAPNLCFVSQGAVQGSWTWKACSGAGGTLTSFSSGDLTGLFTTSVATATSTPALSFTAANFSAHTFWGNNTGSTAAGSAVQPSVSDLTSGALANGTTATTQSAGDATTDVATDQFVANSLPTKQRFTFYCGGTIGTASATRYGLTPGQNGTSSACSQTGSLYGYAITDTQTITACYVTAKVGGAASGSGAVTLDVISYTGTPGNLSPSTSTTAICTLGIGAGITQCSNTGLSISIAAGNILNAGVTTGQSTDTTSSLSLSCR